MASHSVRIGLADAEAIAATLACINSFRSSCARPDKLSAAAFLNERYNALGVRESATLQLKRLVKPNESTDKFLVRHSRSFLEGDGNSACLKPNYDNPGEEILRWRWMSLALPFDLLLACAVEGNSSNVRILDSSLRILDKTSHIHVHAKAIIPFANVWTDLGEEAIFRNIKSPPIGFSDRTEWVSWLTRGLTARRILEYWMKYGVQSLMGFFDRHPVIHSALTELRCGKFINRSRTTDKELAVFLRLTKQSRTGIQSPETGCTVTGLKGSRHRLAEELAFNRNCLNWMHSNFVEPVARQAFRDLWIQMTRIRVMLFRHLVHDPAHAGLNEFEVRFKRIEEYTSNDTGMLDFVNSATEIEQGLDVETIELRKTPGTLTKLKMMRCQSRRFANNNATSVATCRPKVTWTLHFIRDKDSSNPIRHRLQHHQATAYRLETQLRGQPNLLQSIRGLDVAGRELSGPLWAVSAAIAHVRKVSIQVCAENRDLNPLKLTVHAGEDFHHLLSGLRAIHEPFWWQIMRRGDRIGHALALGLDPEEWCYAHPIVHQPRFERMMDLAWLLDFCRLRRLLSVSGAWLSHARDEIHEHLQKWVVEASVDDFVRGARSIGRLSLSSDYCYDFSPDQNNDKVSQIISGLFRQYDRKSDIICVRTDGEAKVLTVVRDELAELLAKWRTPIEVNPSSNLLIGRLKHPIDQPLFFLDPTDSSEHRGLELTLSADDPICFATSLADEYAYAWAGMVVGGNVPPAFAHQWLERAARNARRAAFS